MDGRSTGSLGGLVSTFVSAYLVHVLRVLLAALAIALPGLLLWLLVGLLTGALGVQSPIVVLISTVVIGICALLGGSFYSARRITPDSILHPVLAAVTVGLVCISAFSSGDVGALSFGLPATAAIVAAIGAFLGRSSRTPPNQRLERP